MNQNYFINAFFNSIKKLLPILTLFSIQLKSSFAQVQTQTAVSANVSTYIKGYYESLPVDYKSSTTKKYPLLIFLHGGDERGNGTTGLPKVLKNAIPKLINKGQFPSKFRVGGKDFSFIVISPQLVSSNNYPVTIRDLVSYCKNKYRVDEQRIYITGLSFGGLLSWNFTGSAKANAEIFAAMVTVCSGGVPTEGRVASVASAKLPVWVTNNSGDPYNSATLAKQTVEKLNAYKPAPPKAVLTIFQKGGHDAWTQTYDPNFRQDGLNIYEWMLSYTRGGTNAPLPKPDETTAPPVAKAGSNQTITLPTNSVTLSSSGSTASSGSIKSYSWKKVSGPSGGSITSSTSASTKVTGLTEGVYKFQLTVTDSNNKTAIATVTVTVKPEPVTAIALKANAGTDQTITYPQSVVTLDGSKSTSETTIKNYVWKKVSGPAGVLAPEIAKASDVKTQVTNLVPGTYVFQLKITDAAGNTATDNITVKVKYKSGALKANAGPDQVLEFPLKERLILDGSASTATAFETTCSWTRLSGPGSYGAVTYPSINLVTTTALNLVAGVYKYQLTLKDKEGNISTDVVTITVKSSEPEVVLKAVAGANQTIVSPASSVKLDGSASTVAKGNSIKKYIWDKISGPNSRDEIVKANSATTAVENLVPGTYTFRLRVIDDHDNEASDKVVINVKYKSGALKANAGPDQTITLPTETGILLNGSASTTPGGSSAGISCSWTRLSGPGASGAVLYPSVILNTNTAKALTSGVYQYQLTLTDNEGNTSTDVVKVTVKNASAASGRASSDQSAVAEEDASALTADKGLLDIKINPNPVRSDMTVWVEGTATGKVSMMVYSLQGKALMQQEFTKDAAVAVSKSVNVSHLPAGIYIVNVIVDGKHHKSMQVTKQ
ncbi:MAG: T9SS type A sorting domain-containing protein [Chitinophagaceae bacterium]|nr:T9SS type A sorting domain-containing protein [Chitinophagaceae bacterium]